MNNLGQFLGFDWERFAKDKKFLVTGSKTWVDFNTKQKQGIEIETVIYEDNTAYKQNNETDKITNRFEKLKFKVNKDVSIPLNSFIVPVDAVATVYGDYRNQLSVKASDIKVIQSNTQHPQPLLRKE